MYKCLKENCLSYGDYQIVPIRPEDIENIRLWRNGQINVLRQQNVITEEAQKIYFQQHVWPTFQEEKPLQVLFSFLLKNRCIGYGGLTYLNWENCRSEVSFLIEPDRDANEGLYKQDFTYFLTLLCQVAFEQLDLHRLIAETYVFRSSTLSVLESLGFQREGVLHEHVYKHGEWIDSIVLALLARD